MAVDSLRRDRWECFCRQWGKSEDEMKSLLFQGELNKKEYEMPWGMTGFNNGSATNSGEYSLYQIKNGEYTQVD